MIKLNLAGSTGGLGPGARCPHDEYETPRVMRGKTHLSVAKMETMVNQGEMTANVS